MNSFREKCTDIVSKLNIFLKAGRLSSTQLINERPNGTLQSRTFEKAAILKFGLFPFVHSLAGFSTNIFSSFSNELEP